MIKIQTEFGDISVKVGRENDKILHISPEYEDCKRIAREKNIPLKELFQKAMDIAREKLK